MPLQLNYTNSDTDQNVPASYWFIKYAIFDFVSNTVEFQLCGYNNLAAKNASKNPFERKAYVLTFAQLSITGSSTFAQAATSGYAWIKANDTMFASSTTV